MSTGTTDSADVVTSLHLHQLRASTLCALHSHKAKRELKQLGWHFRIGWLEVEGGRFIQDFEVGNYNYNLLHVQCRGKSPNHKRIAMRVLVTSIYLSFLVFTKHKLWDYIQSTQLFPIEGQGECWSNYYGGYVSMQPTDY